MAEFRYDTPGFFSRRSPVLGTNAMVACSQPQAARAGYDILRAGGNAVDAAVAIAACLNVTEPSSTGVGGDAFLLYYDAKAKTVRGLNGSGRSPAALTADIARRDASQVGVDGMQPRHAHCVTVPGAAALWVDAVESFGSMPLLTVLQPAINLADEGFPVEPIASGMWQAEEQRLLTSSPGGTDLLIDKKAPKPGQIMRLPQLAETFRQLGQHGKKGFYEGRIGQAIIDVVTSHGGLLSLDDLKAHKTEEVEPIFIDFENRLRVFEIPPNGQGLTALLILRILENTPGFAEASHNSPQYLHLLIEAIRIAFADTRQYIADPEHVRVPVKELLSDDYIKSRVQLINPVHANPHIAHGHPTPAGDTVYFCVVDKDGNAASFINSIYMPFGSCLTPLGCGFTLQNRGANFPLIEGHANVVAPRKRPYHTIIPSMVTTVSGELVMPFGVMGFWMQPQGQVQVLLNMFKFGMNPQTALDAPRLCISPGAADGNAFLEEGLEDLAEPLNAMGHTTSIVRGWQQRGLFGRGQVIHQSVDALTGQRVLAGGSDPRGDGMAIGW